MSVFKYAHTVTSKHRGPQVNTTSWGHVSPRLEREKERKKEGRKEGRKERTKKGRKKEGGKGRTWKVHGRGKRRERAPPKSSYACLHSVAALCARISRLNYREVGGGGKARIVAATMQAREEIGREIGRAKDRQSGVEGTSERGSGGGESEGINKAWRKRGRHKGGQGRQLGSPLGSAQQALPPFCPGAEVVLASLLLPFPCLVGAKPIG